MAYSEHARQIIEPAESLPTIDDGSGIETTLRLPQVLYQKNWHKHRRNDTVRPGFMRDGITMISTDHPKEIPVNWYRSMSHQLEGIGAWFF